MPSHFVVYTQPNAEQRAYAALRDRDCRLYFPRIKVLRAHAGRVDWAHRPFLSRYLFAEASASVSAIKRADGVVDVVRYGLQPATVPQCVVDAIRSREKDGFVDLDGERDEFEPGDRLMVKSGQYAGHRAIFREMSSSRRALVFLDAVIGRVKTRLPLAELERVA